MPEITLAMELIILKITFVLQNSPHCVFPLPVFFSSIVEIAFV